MTANQEAFRARRKIVRFAVPVSLAAAASIAVLLWVAGGTTPQGSAVAAADGLEQPIVSKAPLAPEVQGIWASYSSGRTISMSESARVAQELRADAGLSLTSPTVRMKPLIWDDDLTRLGGTGQ